MSGETARILVVDDEIKICQSCVKILSRMDYAATFALNGADALILVEAQPFDVIITDLKMSRMGGMELLRQVRKAHPDTLVIVITGYASVSSAVEVMKLGAFDYLPKPFTPHELRGVVFQALAERDNRIQRRQWAHQRGNLPGIAHRLVGRSPKIQKVISMVAKVAPTDSNVLVHGESGTGKELVARAVHANSRRSERVFFAVDCGTLSDNLLESELFGHLKGAFTGADRDKQGMFERADGGTVFLDEISNISTKIQGKLLRFLETRELIPLGGTDPRKVDVRLIFATNRNLEKMVENGRFREDFYYRIFVYPIYLPTLRDRREDIPAIAHHFLDQFSRVMGKRITGFDDEAGSRLTGYDWPGNVRQLRNIVERAVILSESELITFRDLPDLMESGNYGGLAQSVPLTNEELKLARKEIRNEAVSRVEINFLTNALARNEWNITQAARETGLQRTNFQALMKKHGITLPKMDKS